MTHYQAITAGECTPEQWEQFFNCFICIPAMTLYCAAKCMGEKLQGVRVQKILPVFGGAVFGVYLIEKFARALTDRVYVWMSPVVGSFVASLIWAFAALCLSMLIVLIGKQTPGIKKLVNRLI